MDQPFLSVRDVNLFLPSHFLSGWVEKADFSRFCAVLGPCTTQVKQELSIRLLDSVALENCHNHVLLLEETIELLADNLPVVRLELFHLLFKLISHDSYVRF